MLSDAERAQLSAMLQVHTPRDLVAAIVEEIQRFSVVAPVGAAWGADAVILQRILPRLWVKRGRGAQ